MKKGMAIFKLAGGKTKQIKNSLNKIVTSMKPSYSVIFTMYHVIPGMPVKRNATKHEFGKGSYKEAKNFFDKVVHKTNEVRIAPVEVYLVKGRKKIVQKTYFGPVNELKKMRMSA